MLCVLTHRRLKPGTYEQFRAAWQPNEWWPAFRRGYHLRAASHSAVLPDEFLDRFTVVGPADHCAERLRELAGLGLDRIIMVPASRDADPELVAASNRHFAEEVIPRLRG